MNELRDLYQEVILDHNHRPRNFRQVAPATHHAKGFNPLCGDQVEIWLDIQDGIIKDIGFTGKGCAISTASASLMTEALRGKSVKEALELFETVRTLATTDIPPMNAAGKLSVLAGVRQFPTRVKCATLPWHTLTAALKEQEKTISTEEE
ncbi:MAG TPA: SUF system NifU family Fe-S cluster assembly protein [Burkholderiales bacterium]|nr:SUF system NifU family Fe-S cluster assembly protein [Burkholderiales bacterium]